MKRSLFSALAIAILLTPVTSLCQEEADETTSREAKKKVLPALKVGITRSNVYDRQGEAFISEGSAGFGAGASLALPLGSFLGLQPELLLLQKGFEGAGRLHGEQYMIKRTTTHLDVPVQLQIKPFRWFTFLVGPQWSFVLNQNDSYSLGNNTLAKEIIEESNVRENLFGTLVGFDLNFGHVILGMRSGWDVQANHADGSSEVPRYRNRWLFWSIGYRFY